MQKFVLFGFCFIFAFTCKTLGQNNRSPDATCVLTGEPGQIESIDSLTSIQVRAILRLRIKNLSNKNIIFWNRLLPETPNDGMIVKLLLSRSESFQENEIISTYNWFPSDLYSKEWDDLRLALDADSPASDKTILVKPNESWEFSYRDFFFNISKKKLFASFASSPSKNDRQLPQVWIRLHYATWSPNIEPRQKYRAADRLFGRMLQKRWESSGYLMLEELVSEPISLDLSSAIVKKEPTP
ncbi:MAG: hypothetical protein IPK58_12480 [Acidobacteria bacterium]|nr:hypothetical protein [Acidobacteriota bacterium]